MDVAELRDTSFFKGMSNEEIAECAPAFEPFKRLGGERVTTEDEFGYSFFIILSGSVEVEQHDGGTIATLGSGDYFGEMALVSGEKRNATVRATETCQMARTMNWDFQKLLEEHPTLAARIQAVFDQRS